MYVCKNKDHDGDRNISVTASVYEVGDQIYCEPCFHDLMTPKPKRKYVLDPVWETRGLNAAQQAGHA